MFLSQMTWYAHKQVFITDKITLFQMKIMYSLHVRLFT